MEQDEAAAAADTVAAVDVPEVVEDAVVKAELLLGGLAALLQLVLEAVADYPNFGSEHDSVNYLEPVADIVEHYFR